MEDADKLIYEKSNTYRLHADNIRWALLGGYAAFFGATIQIANTPPIGVVLFLIAIVYLIVLGVQNWFYNLFALFVKECESRLAANERLRPLEDFAQEVGGEVNPFHPAFFFAMLVVVVSAVA
jgi:sulfite exporter TauE/SafE